MKKTFLAAAPILVLACLFPAAGNTQDPFYKDKTITIIAGSGAGNVYDIYARWFAKYLPKYIPGNPNMIVQNMPGAASMIAANYPTFEIVANENNLSQVASLWAWRQASPMGRPRAKKA